MAITAEIKNSLRSLTVGIQGMSRPTCCSKWTLGTERTKVCTLCGKVFLSEFPKLLCVSEVGCVRSTFAT